MTLFRPEAGGWQTFLPLSPADLDALRAILTSSWLTRSSGVLTEHPTTGQLFHLHVGDLSADLRFQLPFDLASWPDRLTLLRDGWRIDQICQYRPLIYYAAFGSPEILEQFAISVRSLIEFGRYQGPIVVLTDQTPEALARYLAGGRPGARCACCNSSRATGRASWRRDTSYWTGRMQDDSSRCSMSIPTSCSIGDVTPMLHAIARSDHIAAPIELLSTLSASPASGATLLQRDFCSPGFMAGFNTGTLGIPNLRAHAETLRLIRRIIMNHSTLHGRMALPYVDQEIANYVSYRLAHFDTGLISRFVRFAGDDATPAIAAGWCISGRWPVRPPGRRRCAIT